MTAIAASPAPIDEIVSVGLLVALAVWGWVLHRRPTPRDAATVARHRRTTRALTACTRHQETTR